MGDSDAVMNDETRRALRRRGRQLGMGVVGAAVALVLLGMAGGAAILSVPWQFSLAVTVGVTVGLPVAVPYAMLRVAGLSHEDVAYVGKQAYREGVTEAIALSGDRQTADVFSDRIALDPEAEDPPSEGDSATDDAAGIEAEAEGEGEGESTEIDTDESRTETESIDQPQQAEPTAEAEA